MALLSKWTVRFVAGAAVSLLACGATTDPAHLKTQRDYGGFKCTSRNLYVDSLVSLDRKAFCAKDKDFCFDALATIHLAEEKTTYAYLLLDRHSPRALSALEQILSDAHNTKQTIQITYIPEGANQCESIAPILLEKDLVGLEIVK